MNANLINRFRTAGFIGACVAAALVYMGGDVATAGGIVAAALSTAGSRQE